MSCTFYVGVENSVILFWISFLIFELQAHFFYDMHSIISLD